MKTEHMVNMFLVGIGILIVLMLVGVVRMGASLGPLEADIGFSVPPTSARRPSL